MVSANMDPGARAGDSEVDAATARLPAAVATLRHRQGPTASRRARSRWTRRPTATWTGSAP
ncbi:hypothetical protein [Pseudonocardia adelaidensis]|uniref:hypothetical protein n=1 Tax=Pseudonocardia adelaidensis TaxID=648754 RepID=UPI0031E55CE6